MKYFDLMFLSIFHLDIRIRDSILGVQALLLSQSEKSHSYVVFV